MTIRMTLTAVALASVALTGCGMMGGKKTMTAPMVTAPAMTAPAMTAPAMTVTAPTVAVPTMTAPMIGTEAMALGNDAMVVGNDAMTMGNDAMRMGNAMYNATEPMMVNDGMMADDAMMSNSNGEGISDANMSGNDDSSTNVMAGESMADMADMSADDAVMNACFQAGGQVVSWVGDSSGATQACRREDGLEYRLADAQYYQ